MGSIWRVAVGSAVLTVLMQAANWFFEAIGSVPDMEGCGFLAGGVGILAFTYPLFAVFVSYHAARRSAGPRMPAGSYALIGALGSGTYLILGVLLAISREQYGALSPQAVAWSGAYIFLAAIGAATGPAWADIFNHRLALSDSGS